MSSVKRNFDNAFNVSEFTLPILEIFLSKMKYLFLRKRKRWSSLPFVEPVLFSEVLIERLEVGLEMRPNKKKIRPRRKFFLPEIQVRRIFNRIAIKTELSFEKLMRIDKILNLYIKEMRMEFGELVRVLCLIVVWCFL